VTQELKLDCEIRGTTAEVTVDGDLDMAAAFKLEPVIERLVSEGDVEELVLDLAGVNFIDSAGVGSLVSTQQRLDELGVSAKVRRPSEAVRRVLDVSGAGGVLG
jgi:anti-sigma B factor antagonist